MFKFTRSTLGFGAVVLAAPLVLAACGSDEESAAEATTSAAASSTTVRATSSAAASDSAAAEAGTADGAAANVQLENPLAGGVAEANLEPVTGGQPADSTDAAAIESLVKGYNDQTSVRQMTEYTYDHLCAELVENNGGRDAFLAGMGGYDMAFSDIPGYDAEANRITEVRDIQVSGQDASAIVINALDSSVMRFRNEDGAWKFCG